MKINIICKEPFPHGMAGTKRIICYAKALILAGIECEVTVFGRTERAGRIVNTEASGVFEGIPFRYIGGSTVKPSRKIPRIWNECRDEFLLCRHLKATLCKGDVVLAYFNGNNDLACKLIDIVHSKGASYVRELCEIPFFGNNDKKSKEGLRDSLERLFPKIDGFIAISDALVNLAGSHKSPSARILKLPILVDFNEYELADKSAEATVPYIFHSGTLYEQKDGILGMIEAFGKVLERTGSDFRMICTGSLDRSPERESIERLIKEYKLEGKLIFTGFLSTEELKEKLSGAAFTIINKHDNIQNTYCFSTKLAEYMAAGKAVIITDVGEAMNWLEDGRTAWIVKRSDTETLSRAMEKAFTDPAGRKAIGEAGRAACRKNFDYRSAAEPLKKFLTEL